MKRFKNLTLALSLVFALGILFTNATYAQQKGTGTPKGQGQYFVDQNGDGICDNLGTCTGQKVGNAQKANSNGNQNGTGLKGAGNGTGVCNGTGNGTGVCDGTGPKGSGLRGGKK